MTEKTNFSTQGHSGIHTRRRVAQRWLIDNIIRSVGNVPSTNLGPAPAGLVADWMNARLAGKPFASERWLVEAGGNIVKTPY